MLHRTYPRVCDLDLVYQRERAMNVMCGRDRNIAARETFP